jgi:predicted ester cyclase
MNSCDVVRRFSDLGWGAGDHAVVDELVHPDAVPPTGYDQPGPESWKAYIDQVRAAFSDYTSVAEDVFGDDDLVCVRFTTTGRHTGELFGFPASGNQVQMTGVGLVRLRDGKVHEYLGEQMMAQLMAQITAPPA